MKKITNQLLIAAIALSVGFLPSCKGKNKEKETTATVAPAETTPAPVVVSTDDELVTKTKDATKDFPTVTATTANGEITLTGSIKRDKLPTLMQTLNALHAKKINNNLTIEN